MLYTETHAWGGLIWLVCRMPTVRFSRNGAQLFSNPVNVQAEQSYCWCKGPEEGEMMTVQSVKWGGFTSLGGDTFSSGRRVALSRLPE